MAKRANFDETSNTGSFPAAKYSKELREFSVSLHNTSAAAYRYVRQELGNILPSEKTIQRWMVKVDGSPGFSRQVSKLPSKLDILMFNLISYLLFRLLII